MVQRADFPLDAAALRHVDHREMRCIDDLASNNDIGPTEKDSAVTIGVCCRLPVNEDAFLIQIQIFPGLVEGFGRPGVLWKWRLPSAWGTHSEQDRLGSENRRRSGAQDIAAGFRQPGVATHIFGVSTRIDDVANRLIGDPLNSFQYAIGRFSCSGVDYYSAIRSDLDRDVSAGPKDDIEIGANP